MLRAPTLPKAWTRSSAARNHAALLPRVLDGFARTPLDPHRLRRPRSGVVLHLTLLATSALIALACAGPSPDEPATRGPRKFVVMIEGRNLVLEYAGGPERFGFSATRNVVAQDAMEAERVAIQQIRDDAELSATLLNGPDDPPRYTVTHHIEVESFGVNSRIDRDYIFYRDRDTR